MSEQFQYGFRVDPMEFVAHGEGLQAALVRTVIFETPGPNDAAVIEAHFAEIFATQNDDGSFTDKDEPDRLPLAATSARLRDLLIDGCSPDRPEMQRAIAFVEQALAELPQGDWPEMPLPTLRAMCLLGRTDHPAIKARVEALADEVHELLGKGCPGTPFAQLINLWIGRNAADVDDAIEGALAWVEQAVEPPGCRRALGLCDPGSIIEALAQIDHPAAACTARTLVPMLLRIQNPDGSFGEESNTFWTFVLLDRYGLLDELRTLPPLPNDWRVVRAIPSPDRKDFGWANIAFDGGRLWLYDGSTSSAIAISPDDGAVLQRTALPQGTWCTAFGAWDGFLWVLTGERKETKTLHKVDADSGEVLAQIPLDAFLVKHFVAMDKLGDKIMIPDQWEGCVWVFDPADPSGYEEVFLATGMADYVTGAGDEVWALSCWAPALIRTNLAGRLLDWGDRPFGWRSPIAWDGDHLWAVDDRNKRICLIEKASPAEAPSVERTRQLIQTEPAFDIPKLDGETLDERALAVDVLSPIFQRTDGDNFDARFALGWSDEGLRVAVSVRDDDFIAADSDIQLWENQADCVLIYVRPPGGEVRRIVVEPGMTDEQPQPRALLGPALSSGRPADDITITRNRRDGGYEMELVIPWSDIGIEAAKGQELRLQLAALDVDRAGDELQMHGLMWYPAVGTRQDPSISYRVRLAEQASPAAAAWVRLVKNAHGMIDSIGITAPAEEAGKTVTIASGGTALAETRLVPDGAGMSVGWIPLPAADNPWPLTVTLDGNTVATFDPAAAAND